LILWLLAAIGRVPSKLTGPGGTGVEFPSREAVKRLTTKVAEKTGVDNPEELGEKVGTAYWMLAEAPPDVSRTGSRPGGSSSDEYLDELAEAAVMEPRQGLPGGERGQLTHEADPEPEPEPE